MLTKDDRGITPAYAGSTAGLVKEQALAERGRSNIPFEESYNKVLSERSLIAERLIMREASFGGGRQYSDLTSMVFINPLVSSTMRSSASRSKRFGNAQMGLNKQRKGNRHMPKERGLRLAIE